MRDSPGMDKEQVGYTLNFGRRVVRIAALLAGAVCGSAALLGRVEVALGFGLGSLVSTAGFWFAVKKSLSLLSTSHPKRAPALTFKWFVPRYLLYGLALLIGAKFASVDFTSVVCGILLCNAILVLYEPVICRFMPEEKDLSGESTYVSGKWKT